MYDLATIVNIADRQMDEIDRSYPRPVLIYRQVIRRIRLLGIEPMGAILFPCEYLLNLKHIFLNISKTVHRSSKIFCKMPPYLTPASKFLPLKNGVKKLNILC